MPINGMMMKLVKDIYERKIGSMLMYEYIFNISENVSSVNISLSPH
jgi:hypothetical protein